MSFSPNYPVSADVLANPTALTNRDDAGFELHGVISRIQDILEALEAKLGIGSSTPPATAAVLRRTATGASGWAQAQPGDLAAGGTANRLLRTSDGVSAAWAQAQPGDLAAGGTANRLLGTTDGTTVGMTTVSSGMVPANALNASSIYGGNTANRVLRTTDGTNAIWGQVGTLDIAAGAVTQVATVAVPGQSATGTTPNNMTGGLITITTQGGPVLLLFSSRADYAASAAGSFVQVWEGGASVGTLAANGLSPSVSQSRTGHVLLTAPSAGTHFYQLAWFTDVAVQQTTSGATFTAIELKR